MRSKNVINNKNIIQICYEKVKRKKRRQQSRNQYNETSSKSINIQPKFVNSFANSSRLEPDDRKVRFIQSMRDPFSTKSPYSIYDNGSNTFQREGNTSGVEEEVLPQLRQDDYFQEPRSFGGVPQSTRPQYRPPERFQVGSPISPITQMGEYDDDAGRSWHSPNLYGVFEDDSIGGEEQDGSVYEARKDISRFDANTPAQVPTFSSPYRGPETQQLQLDPVKVDDADIEKAYELLEEDIRRYDEQLESAMKAYKGKQPAVEQEEEEVPVIDEATQRQQQKQAYIQMGEELNRKKAIRKKFKSVSDKLQDLIATGEKKVKKNSDLKNEIIELLKDKTFTEYTGPTNIRNLTDAESILKFLNKGSTQVIEEIKQIEADKKETPKGRNPPRTKGNIQTFAKAGGGGGSGISQYSKLPISSR
jgi:hypothetical protein